MRCPGCLGIFNTTDIFQNRFEVQENVTNQRLPWTHAHRLYLKKKLLAKKKIKKNESQYKEFAPK